MQIITTSEVLTKDLVFDQIIDLRGKADFSTRDIYLKEIALNALVKIDHALLRNVYLHKFIDNFLSDFDIRISNVNTLIFEVSKFKDKFIVGDTLERESNLIIKDQGDEASIIKSRYSIIGTVPLNVGKEIIKKYMNNLNPENYVDLATYVASNLK